MKLKVEKWVKWVRSGSDPLFPNNLLLDMELKKWVGVSGGKAPAFQEKWEG
jgi:hypothetical protein